MNFFSMFLVGVKKIQTNSLEIFFYLPIFISENWPMKVKHLQIYIKFLIVFLGSKKIYLVNESQTFVNIYQISSHFFVWSMKVKQNITK